MLLAGSQTSPLGHWSLLHVVGVAVGVGVGKGGHGGFNGLHAMNTSKALFSSTFATSLLDAEAQPIHCPSALMPGAASVTPASDLSRGSRSTLTRAIVP